MTRLDGEKKSPLPWIIGLLVLALLAAAIYYFAVARGTDAVVANENGVELIDNRPGGLGIDNNAADANMTDANAMDNNMADANMADANMVDANGAMIGGTDTNMADNNAMDANSTLMGNSPLMDNSAMDNSAMDSNSAMMSNSTGTMTPGAPVPALTPASANPAATPSGVVATRSKTIKTDDKTVIYQKSVKADGTVMRDKKIVGEPVKAAKP